MSRTVSWSLLLLSIVCVPIVLVFGGGTHNHSQFDSTSEAPTGFDNRTNGLVDQSTHDANTTVFQEVEEVDEGIGPVFNESSCAACHSGPTVGGNSKVVEVRAGHNNRFGKFVNPTVYINGGQDTITGRSLINQFAICDAAKATVPETENIRTLRISISTLGDGFIEAIDDDTLLAIAQRQADNPDPIRGQAIKVPILEAPGAFRVGRFGWKDQHASLMSFSADAYLNEQGITSRLAPTEITKVCDEVKDPEDQPDADGHSDLDSFAQFIRATKAPPVDPVVASSFSARAGSSLFEKIGCSSCHVRTIKTAPAGTRINGGTFTVSQALGDKIIHPYSDFLLHDVGTGDGIVQNGGQSTAHKLRTPPLWGLRKRPQLMHDGLSKSRSDAILRHRGEARSVISRYKKLTSSQRAQILRFLSSL